MVREVEKWYGIRIWDQITTKSYSVLLIGGELITSAVILHTDTMTDKLT